MTQNDAIKTHKCRFCLYCTKRKFDLKRHHYAKHKDKIFENNELINIKATGWGVSHIGQKKY